jgi:glycosyltransferase involved in cell wall biosynthesis
MIRVNLQAKPRVVLMGGPDVDARIPLMKRLHDDYEVIAAGSSPALAPLFEAAQLPYYPYLLGRGAYPIHDVITVYQVWRLMRRLRPDIVHTFDTKPGVYGRIGALLAHVPVVIGTLPGLGALYARDAFKIRVLRLIYEPLQRAACQRSNLTIFQNEDDRQLFTQLGIAPAHKSTIISGSGVDTQHFDPAHFSAAQRQAWRSQLQIAPEAFVVTLTSRLIRSKGILQFAAAARLLRQSHPHIEFVLAGAHDPESTDHLSAGEMREVQQHVRWIGARTDIAALLAASDLFVLPTQYREGIPRALLEAAAMALPLIATHSPGCKEVIESGVNGLLLEDVEPQTIARAIVEIACGDTALHQQYGAASRQRAVDLFALEHVAAAIRQQYDSLLAERVNGRHTLSVHR